MTNTEYIDRKQFAEMVSVSVSTLNRYLADPDNNIPKGGKIGTGKNATRMWLRSDCVEWVNRRLKAA